MIPSEEYVEPLLAGNRRALARLISRAEAGGEEWLPAIKKVYRHTGKAHVVGVTGVPGSGKSTLLDMLALAVRERGLKVAVVAVDPSSPFSGGSILGDRIRMTELSGDPGVFIRSMATRGNLGGLAAATHDAVDLLDAAGYEMVLIETVGVGQDEVDIVRAAHTVVVVSAPGLGDEIQTIKAGVMEIADIHVVSKCDRSDADRALRDLRSMLAMGLTLNPDQPRAIPVLATSTEKKQGVAELLEEIVAHREWLESSGEIASRRRHIAEMRMVKIAEGILRGQFDRQRDGRAGALIDSVTARELDPHHAARQLIAGLQNKE